MSVTKNYPLPQNQDIIMTSHPHMSNMLKKTLGGSPLMSKSIMLRIILTLSTDTMCFRTLSLITRNLMSICFDFAELVIIAVEFYTSYCRSVAVMASWLNLPSSYNQENITWSGLLIVDTSSIIWICLSDQLHLIRFHVVFCRYRITFLTAF